MTKETENLVHWHFQFIAYKKRNASTNQFEGAVAVDINEATTEEEALAITKSKVKRAGYQLVKAWQCAKCGITDRSEAMQMTQLKMMAKIIKGAGL